MGILDFFAQIVWIAAGLAVFLTVVFAFLEPIYMGWKEAKAEIDTASDLWTRITEAIDAAAEAGGKIRVEITVGEPSEEEQQEAE